MVYSQLQAHLRGRAEMLLSGQIDRMVEDYVFPLPVYLHTSRLVIQSADHARLIFSHLRDALVDRGVVALRPSIAAVDLPRDGRFRVWVDWHEIALPMDATRVSQAVYYCRQTDQGTRTEMVNYTHLSIPELNRQIAALALSA
jgi:hypothetical protein